MRVSLCVLLLMIAAAAVRTPAEAQVGETYCNVTAITTRQLSNGVQVTIEADGEMQWWIDWDEVVSTGAGYWMEFEWGRDIELTEEFTRLPILIHNARSKIGAGFVPISMYPVSHAEVSIPEWWAEGGVGLKVDLVNYLGLVAGEGENRYWRYNLSTDSSEDRSSIIVSWHSDQFPVPPRPATPADLPTELRVETSDGGLTVHAVNAPLQEVLAAISRATGYPITAPPKDDVRVSVELRDRTASEAVRLVATGMGLCADACPEGGWIVAEARAAAGGYQTAETRVLPLEHLKASRMLSLVPTFLLDYLRADDESNAVIVSAPGWMMEKIAADIAALDAAPPEAALEVVVLESESTEELLRELDLTRYLDDSSASIEGLPGRVELHWLEGLGRGWEALLTGLDARSRVRLRARASLRVANGHTARVFAGQQRFVVIENLDNGLTADVAPVDIGTSLDVQPRLGRGDEVVLSLNVSTRTLRGGGDPAALPVVGARRVDTVLRVRDGETVLIAGLTEDSSTRERRSIPVLGWLPLVGRAFDVPVRHHRQTELAIFVTPHILRPEQAGRGDVTHG